MGDSPTSVAHVTNHRTISRRLQLRVDKVILTTWGEKRHPRALGMMPHCAIFPLSSWFNFCPTPSSSQTDAPDDL